MNQMTKWFNTAGPCQRDIHYMLPTMERLPQLKRLIYQRNYFVVHAPRQTGKTTAMLNLAQELTASGEYTTVMVSVEVDSAFNHQPDVAEQAILGAWQQAARFWLPIEITCKTTLVESIGLVKFWINLNLILW
ncbi:hypothetical protein [Cylindrospermopsis curvispora]|uniref:hypothetical protein n=1 Tax=Cylindrospermopsis curvispora TaxID=747548 RepID=UPI001F2D5223|nr:hypothetical protein [Cylindrospermopsis curvispora]